MRFQAFTCFVLVLSGLAGASPAQAATAGADRPAMVATDRHLFVLRGDVVYQLDVHTLEVVRQTRLPAQRDRAAAERPVAGTAVQSALQWLRAHQDADGRWDADGFMKHDKGGASDGAGNPVHDVGVTGLAVLAFLGAGNTTSAGPHRDAVQRGVQWLVAQQDDQGRLGTAASVDFVYDHAIATLALCEAFGLSKADELRTPAQKAIDYLEAHRNPYMVWRYQPRDGDNDTSVTAWCTMAYRSAADFGLKINEGALRMIATWLDQVTDPLTGHAGYTKRGEPSSRHPGDHALEFPPKANETLTAAALLARFLLGQDPAANEVMTRAADTIAAKPPRWSAEDGTIDCLAWYFGTNALVQVGGERWRAWERELRNAVVTTQRSDGSFAGSWDPVGVWDEDGGRVYATALLALALECAERAARLRTR
jgi:hypothetical protein